MAAVNLLPALAVVGGFGVLAPKNGNFALKFLFFCFGQTYAVHFASYFLKVIQ